MMNLFKVSEIHLLIRSMSTDSSTHLVAIVNQQPVPRIHLRCLLQKYCLLFLELQRPLVDEVFQLPIAHGCRRCTVKHHHHHHHHHHHQYHHHLQQQQQQISSLHLSMSLLRQSCHNRCYTILAGSHLQQWSQTSSAAEVDSDGHHPTEKAAAVQPYLQNARRPTAEVIGVEDGGRGKTTRTDTEMDRRHSDVVQSRRGTSNDDDRGDSSGRFVASSYGLCWPQKWRRRI